MLQKGRASGADDGAISRISLIDESGGRRLRMGNLAFLGSHSINGVSALHTELMKKTVFADLHRMQPDKINNKTNGITVRRWLMQCNPELYELAHEAMRRHHERRRTAATAVDALPATARSKRSSAAIKHANKVHLERVIFERLGIRVDPAALFDVQIKRIHEYKRQLLNLVETVALYDQIRSHPERDWTPRVKIFAGKAAPSYNNAKLIIKLANDVARVVNHDPSVRGLLKVVFLPNYNCRWPK